MRTEDVAELCYELNEAYSESIGLGVHAWESERERYIRAVEEAIKDPTGTPEEQHQRWMDDMTTDGWTYNAVYSREKKHHNMLVPWEQVPHDMRFKDTLFRVIIRKISRFIDEDQLYPLLESRTG